jgi:hypothetical protein
MPGRGRPIGSPTAISRRRTRAITLPMITPAILFNVVIGIILAARRDAQFGALGLLWGRPFRPADPLPRHHAHERLA